MGRLRQFAGLAGLVAASAWLTAALYRPVAPAPDERLARWNALSGPQQAALTYRYQAIAGRGNAAETLRRARQFAVLAPAEQARLRWLHDFLENWLNELPASRRLALLTLHERAVLR